MWIPRYLAVSVVWRLCLVLVDLMMFRLLVMCMVWHFCGWKCMSKSDSHLARRLDTLGGHLSLAGW